MMTRTQIIDRFDLTPEASTDLGLPLDQEQCEAIIDRLRRVQIAGARHGQSGYYSDGDFGSDADWCYGIGAEISALESELDLDCGEVMDLYTDTHEAFFRDGTINPGERNAYMRNSCFTFRFGAYGDTHVSVWAQADHLEDALEMAAEWLAEHAPGHIMPEGDEHLESLRREACEEAGLVYPPTCDHSELEELGYYEAFQSAEADLTYTESGYLHSDEWSVSESDSAPGHDPDHRGPRHYGPARNADGTRK